MTIAHESNPHALQLILADTFFDSLDHLEKDEQLRALSFVQELRRSTKSTGASLERIRNARSKNLWSGRITRDLRAILHREGDTLTILHAAHHDPAYRWAERRDIGRHPVMVERDAPHPGREPEERPESAFKKIEPAVRANVRARR